MRFSGLIALRELNRNKIKLILATLTSLILFLSAFLLVNLATALPSNFYTFYEDNYRKDMTIKISDADRELLDASDMYFDEFVLDYKFIMEKFTLQGDGEAQFAFAQVEEAIGGSVTKYYKPDYATVGVIPKKVQKLLDKHPNFVLEGELWQNSASYSNVYLADKAATALGKSVGETISIKLQVPDRNGTPEIVVSDMIVAGIYDYSLASSSDSSFPIFYIQDNFAQLIYLESYDSYKVTGIVKDITQFYSVYNDLSKSYSLADNTVVEMISTVKNSEVICNIIGITMLIGGMIVLMNFITMLISSNRQNLGIMLGLGATYKQIAFGYGMIFFGLVTLITIISLILLPTVNALITVYCHSIGYDFAIKVNYGMIAGLYLLCNVAISIIMFVDKMLMAKSPPKAVLIEED